MANFEVCAEVTFINSILPGNGIATMADRIESSCSKVITPNKTFGPRGLGQHLATSAIDYY